MPSARDLLDKADTLMRINRSVGTPVPPQTVTPAGSFGSPEQSAAKYDSFGDDIPVLTDEVTLLPGQFRIRPDDTGLRDRFSATVGLQDSTIFPASRLLVADSAPASRATTLELPATVEPGVSVAALTRDDAPGEPRLPAVVGERDDAATAPGTVAAGERDDAATAPGMAAAAGERDDAATAPGTVAAGERDDAASAPGMAAAAGERDDAPGEPAEPMAPPLVIPGAVQSAPQPVAPSVVPAEPAAAVPSAAEVADTVYLQVLRQLDLYTDAALQAHLATHLTPILEQASRDMLASVHASLGATIREYVAQAIERELGVRPNSAR